MCGNVRHKGGFLGVYVEPAESVRRSRVSILAALGRCALPSGYVNARPRLFSKASRSPSSSPCAHTHTHFTTRHPRLHGSGILVPTHLLWAASAAMLASAAVVRPLLSLVCVRCMQEEGAPGSQCLAHVARRPLSESFRDVRRAAKVAEPAQICQLVDLFVFLRRHTGV